MSCDKASGNKRQSKDTLSEYIQYLKPSNSSSNKTSAKMPCLKSKAKISSQKHSDAMNPSKGFEEDFLNSFLQTKGTYGENIIESMKENYLEGSEAERMAALESIESIMSESHMQTLSNMDVQLKNLKTQIEANRGLLDATAKSIKLLNFKDSKKILDDFQANDFEKYLENANSTNWEECLETLDCEIKKYENPLKPKSFEASASSDLAKFQNILDGTQKTIEKMKVFTSGMRKPGEEFENPPINFNAATSEFSQLDEKTQRLITKLDVLSLNNNSLEVSAQHTT